LSKNPGGERNPATVVLVVLFVLGATISVVEWIAHTPAAAAVVVTLAAIAFAIAFVRWVRRRNSPARRALRREAVLLHETNQWVKRLRAQADEEKLHSKMTKDRLRAEAEEERLRAEIDESLERRMRGE
jgi:hypothetical protein